MTRYYMMEGEREREREVQNKRNGASSGQERGVRGEIDSRRRGKIQRLEETECLC